MTLHEIPGSVILLAASAGINLFARCATSLLADAGTPVVPNADGLIGGITNISATGAIIWMLLRTLPQMAKDHRDERAAAEASRLQERAADRAEAQAQRERFMCHGKQD